MRLGIFGGSFDPVHDGHLELAVTCRDQAHLDEVRWIPAASQPLKPDGPFASDDDRCAMLQTANAGQEAMVVSRIELDRAGVSYTVDTLREISAAHPGDSLFLLLGADSLVDLPHWREPVEICRLALPLVVSRPDAKVVDFSVLDRSLVDRKGRADSPPQDQYEADRGQ